MTKPSAGQQTSQAAVTDCSSTTRQDSNLSFDSAPGGGKAAVPLELAKVPPILPATIRLWVRDLEMLEEQAND